VLARLKTGPTVGITTNPAGDTYYASVQDDKRVALIDAKTLQETGSIALPGETGAIIFDAKDGALYVTHDNGDEVWAIDTRHREGQGDHSRCRMARSACARIDAARRGVDNTGRAGVAGAWPERTEPGWSFVLMTTTLGGGFGCSCRRGRPHRAPHALRAIRHGNGSP